ncbi:hypothetical protein [Malikia sp.]|uniref:hypothetical protein n=1 Tax=Malikia sp. TaxID=2070706 RepID=UPI00260930EA|nr:hypothetical protein [Malikia sp.]MDD2729078.1 hypothetical protein [Malikia sp.]
MNAKKINIMTFLGWFALGSNFLLATPSWAQDDIAESNFKLSGYVSVVGGKVLNGKLDSDYTGPASINGIQCPCYVADWSNAGVYGEHLSLAQESRIGVQGTYTLTPQASLTGHVVSRGTNGNPDLAWAFGSYKVNQNWEVQLGRKRIPLYYYSDFQDIGVSYPWVTPPPEIYGWEATNYNGASLRYSRDLGNSQLTASVFTGQEKNKKSLYQKLYYPAGDTEVQWNNILGADLEINQGPLTLRAVAMGADVKTLNTNDANPINDMAVLRAYGLAANLDMDRWFILSEFTNLSRDHAESHYKVTAPAQTVGAGMRLGKWTPFLNYSRYTERTTDSSLYTPGSYHRVSATLRYDMAASTAVKVQVDRQIDSTDNFGGHVRVLRVSYDRVF